MKTVETMELYKGERAVSWGQFQVLSLENGNVVWRSPWMRNLILDSGLALIPQHHAGNNSDALEITSLEIGDGSTAVSGSDTSLDNMVVDGIPRASETVTTSSIVIDFFITDAELPDGTYTEVMLRAGSVAYTRALFSTTYTKASGKDTIIRYSLSYSSA